MSILRVFAHAEGLAVRVAFSSEGGAAHRAAARHPGRLLLPHRTAPASGGGARMAAAGQVVSVLEGVDMGGRLRPTCPTVVVSVSDGPSAKSPPALAAASTECH